MVRIRTSSRAVQWFCSCKQDQPLEGYFTPFSVLPRGLAPSPCGVSSWQSVGQIIPHSGNWLFFMSNKFDLASSQLAPLDQEGTLNYRFPTTYTPLVRHAGVRVEVGCQGRAKANTIAQAPCWHRWCWKGWDGKNVRPEQYLRICEEQARRHQSVVGAEQEASD